MLQTAHDRVRGKSISLKEKVMDNDDANKSRKILASNDLKLVRKLTRRDFLKYSGGTAACLYLGTLTTGCGSNSSGYFYSGQIAKYPIDTTVVTTTDRVLSFTMPQQPPGPNSGTGLYLTELHLVDQYSNYGYGTWQFSGEGLQIKPRFDLMPSSFPATAAALTRLQQFSNFFAITDIHITDKEAPNQLIFLQQLDAANSGTNTSIYSPVMAYTTQVLDAAIQTVNALHQKKPFNFGISLGDTCNNTSYNELRWYIDVIDGKPITPSSGAHLGADTIDYQKPFQAAGLDKSISWYQALGNHDHFYIGSFPVENSIFDLKTPYTSGEVWAVPDILDGSISTFPAMIDMQNFTTKTPNYYQGVLDGSTPTGTIIDAGTFPAPRKVAADPNRRSLLRTEWIQEFSNTSTSPKGHGFNLVDPGQQPGFACYSFLPDPNVPLKIIVLDNTQSETDGSHDIHGHGCLDATRWAWLQKELTDGKSANQLMIIAAHIPIAVRNIGSETEWWESDKDPNAIPDANAVTLTELVATLWNTPNLLMWMAGHRHLNTIKAFPSPDLVNAPERGFWQVETSSLRDHPQQFRTFEIFLNSDYSVSIVTTNVDPAVAPGTPAAKSRYYSIATQQIIQTNLRENNYNFAQMYGQNVETMDPTRLQSGSSPIFDKNDPVSTDPTIWYGSVKDVPYCGSYNAELYKQLSPAMIAVLKAKYPTTP
jgi:metallophosphoesterase (TIGR03768 family)